MTTNPLLHESRLLLEDWLAYFSGTGTSFGLRTRSQELLSRLPDPPRYVASTDEQERMVRNGEA